MPTLFFRHTSYNAAEVARMLEISSQCRRKLAREVSDSMHGTNTEFEKWIPLTIQSRLRVQRQKVPILSFLWRNIVPFQTEISVTQSSLTGFRSIYEIISDAG